ncbi:retrovirus-related pol polyprotein from transposon TNT 1-94 [Tanacetum coccineum]
MLLAQGLSDGIDTFDSDCDEVPVAQATFMDNLLSYDSDVLSEVSNYNTYHDNTVLEQNVQEMQYSEQPVIDDYSNNEITSDNNVILYNQYLKESENEVVQSTASPDQQNAMIMSVIKEMSSQVAKCNAVNKENKIVNESLTDKKYFEIEKDLFNENDRLLEHIIYQDVMCTTIRADFKHNCVLPANNNNLAYAELENSYIAEHSKVLELEAELVKIKNMIEQDVFIELSKIYSKLEKHCISLEIVVQQTQLQAKNITISNLKTHIQELKGKNMADCTEYVTKSKVIASEMFKLDLEPLTPKLKKNKEAHVNYLKTTKVNADTLCYIVEQAKTSNPLDSAIEYACMYAKQIQELLVYVSDTCPSSRSNSEKLVAVTSINKNRQVTFAKTSATSENNTQKRVDLHKTQTTNKPLVPSKANIRIDNGIEFANQTLKSYCADVEISHQTTVARTPQQNDVVERWNRTLVEAAHTMLIFSKAPLFLWAEAVATAYLKHLHVFGSLCYPTNDSEDIGKLKPKADIGIFIGYSPAKNAYRIYNKKKRMITETIHFEFDELTAMASE